MFQTLVSKTSALLRINDPPPPSTSTTPSSSTATTTTPSDTPADSSDPAAPAVKPIFFPGVDDDDAEACEANCGDCSVHFPGSFAGSIDEEDALYGKVDGWATHVLVATGRTNWKHVVAEEEGSLMQALETKTAESGSLMVSASNMVPSKTGECLHRTEMVSDELEHEVEQEVELEQVKKSDQEQNPEQEPEPETASTEPEQKPEQEPNPEPEQQPELDGETVQKPEPETASNEPEQKPEQKPDPEPKQTPDPEQEPVPKPERETVSPDEPEPKPEQEPDPEPKQTPDPEQEPVQKPEQETESPDEPEPKPKQEPDPEPKPKPDQDQDPDQIQKPEPKPAPDPDLPTTVLLLPAFILVDDVRPSDVDTLVRDYIERGPTSTTPLAAGGAEPGPLPSSLHARASPHDYLILLCSHKTRDARCGLSAPLLRREFERQLRMRGLLRDSAHDDRPGGAAVYFISHVGGHKYSANVMIYRRREGQGIWLARVRPEDCAAIVSCTVLRGQVVQPQRQLRGGFDRGRGLTSW
ncbi:MAG: hypothetical protein M1826_003640 [Phylliscum demangeonii]|nr:MAG: hypothetical protein M1826_003640 [Phylliscum demangeonii]